MSPEWEVEATLPGVSVDREELPSPAGDTRRNFIHLSQHSAMVLPEGAKAQWIATIRGKEDTAVLGREDETGSMFLLSH
ncbi:hypothetical protein F4695_001883 [Rhizobium soli]|uniref:Uncharacterized protein n=1 Tax=Rhizobium soli TaxID=424798 RepID=A0A7X0MRF3_9HYPH|nr:hypothetical protein [Rhizobium soli]